MLPKKIYVWTDEFGVVFRSWAIRRPFNKKTGCDEYIHADTLDEVKKLLGKITDIRQIDTLGSGIERAQILAHDAIRLLEKE